MTPAVNYRYWGIVPAAGIGTRMKVKCPKQYLKVGGRYILDHALSVLFCSPQVQKIVVSISPDDAYWHSTQASQESKVMTCIGGQQRVHSVWNALTHIKPYAEPDDWVLFHDAVRPCLSYKELNRLFVLDADPVGGILALPIVDAIKKSDSEQYIQDSLERRDLWRALTPQMFRYHLILDAIENVINTDHEVEDEASAMQIAGHPVRLVEGDTANIKLTYPADLSFVEAYLDVRNEAGQEDA